MKRQRVLTFPEPRPTGGVFHSYSSKPVYNPITLQAPTCCAPINQRQARSYRTTHIHRVTLVPRPLSSFNYPIPSFRLLLTAFASSADPQTPFDGIYQGSCIAPLLLFRFPVPISSHEIPSKVLHGPLIGCQGTLSSHAHTPTSFHSRDNVIVTYLWNSFVIPHATHQRDQQARAYIADQLYTTPHTSTRPR